MPNATSVDASAQVVRAADGNTQLKLSDRVRVLALGAYERLQPQDAHDIGADAAACSITGDLEWRLAARAKLHRAAPALNDALRHVKRALTAIILIAIVLALLAGAAAATAALATPRGEPVNIYWALMSILGLQTALLLLWFVTMFLARNARASMLSAVTLGGVIFRLSQFLAAKLHQGPHHAAAIIAIGSVYGRGRLGKWTLSSISHLLWLIFNIACIASLVFMLSARQYTFAWETTILSERQYIPLTEAIAALPRAAGFITPTREQIAASQWPDDALEHAEASREMRQAWSGLLIGAIVLYGFAPRLLLLGFSLGQRRHAAQTYRIDVSAPEFASHAARLVPQTQRIGVVDADAGEGDVVAPRAISPELPVRPISEPAILAFELPDQAAAGSWPPRLHNVRWLDLGAVDTRSAQRRVLQQIAQSSSEPSTVVVVCALTSTPDRGAAAFLRELGAVTSQPITLVLSAGELLRQRASHEQVKQRVKDWVDLGCSAGVEPNRILDVDLAHLTHVSASQITALLEGQPPEATLLERGIFDAFHLIHLAAMSWIQSQHGADMASRAELHRDIAALYSDSRDTWRDLLAAPSSFGANVAGQLKSSAERMVHLMPMGLKQSPKWIAAGAVAGALGCIAAATLIAPVAISALPLWSALGAGISALSAFGFGARTPKPETTTASEDVASAVRAAALFALVLELQGRGEGAITRILERALSTADADLAMTSADDVKRWLDDVRHRLDLALAQEPAT